MTETLARFYIRVHRYWYWWWVCKYSCCWNWVLLFQFRRLMWRRELRSARHGSLIVKVMSSVVMRALSVVRNSPVVSRALHTVTPEDMNRGLPRGLESRKSTTGWGVRRTRSRSWSGSQRTAVSGTTSGVLLWLHCSPLDTDALHTVRSNNS